MLKTSGSILLGKGIKKLATKFNLGSGGTWPGELALRIHPLILRDFAAKIANNIILVVGTNGKTTTSALITKVLKISGFKVIHNQSGANLANGLVSAFINNYALLNKQESVFAVFEVDENSLPGVLNDLIPKYIICLNLFRDQLDRYGEVDVIAQKWQKALSKLPSNSKVLLNADDPQIAYLGKNLNCQIKYFGLNKKSKLMPHPEHATDSIFCLNCESRLVYKGFYFSHLGIWKCKNCGFKRPHLDYSKEIPVLPGFYNLYNALAAYSLVKELKIPESKISVAFKKFKPAFGRQEEIYFKNRKIRILLSKNPAGFNQTLSTIKSLNAKNLLILLNDRIPDGRDVSWIWDVDFERIASLKNITLSGDRVYDLAIRLKYADLSFKSLENLNQALDYAVSNINESEVLYILPTYSAMLEIRKIITGKKIL